MSDTLFEKIKDCMRRDFVSFVELMDRCGEEAEGNLAIEIMPNLIWWTGMSDAFLSAIERARKEGIMHPHPTSALTYIVDGCILKMPLAKRPRPGGYKEPHWLPVTFVRGDSDGCQYRKECPWARGSRMSESSRQFERRR